MRFGERKSRIPNDFHNRLPRVITLSWAYLLVIYINENYPVIGDSPLGGHTCKNALPIPHT